MREHKEIIKCNTCKKEMPKEFIKVENADFCSTECLSKGLIENIDCPECYGAGGSRGCLGGEIECMDCNGTGKIRNPLLEG